MNDFFWTIGVATFLCWVAITGCDLTNAAVDHFATPPHLTTVDKAPAPRTKYTDDLESFVTYDVAPKDRPAALLGAQRAVSWMDRHGALDYFPPDFDAPIPH